MWCDEQGSALAHGRQRSPPRPRIVSMIVVDQVELAASTVATVMITWTTAAVFAGGWSLIRRDTA